MHRCQLCTRQTMQGARGCSLNLPTLPIRLRTGQTHLILWRPHIANHSNKSIRYHSGARHHSMLHQRTYGVILRMARAATRGTYTIVSLIFLCNVMAEWFLPKIQSLLARSPNHTADTTSEGEVQHMLPDRQVKPINHVFFTLRLMLHHRAL